MSKPDIEAIRQSPRQYCTVEDVETLSDYAMALEERVEIVEQQLAAAIAACKLKDEALWETNKYLDQTYADLIGNYGSEWLAARMVDTLSTILSKAIAIQPDDSALKVWIGEPVLYKWSDEDKAHHFTTNATKAPAYAAPLYSPKGLVEK